MVRQYVHRVRPTALKARATVACLVILFAGCSDESDDLGREQKDSGASSGVQPDIKCPDDLPLFTATPETGLEADETAHGTLGVRVISADPVLPKKNAENDWTVQFMDKEGAPIHDVEIASACAFMPPPHGHGTAPLKGVKSLSMPGQFELDYLNFIMRGPWQLQLAVRRTNAPHSNEAEDADASTDPAHPEYTDCDRMRRHPGTEKAIFHFCVPN